MAPHKSLLQNGEFFLGASVATSHDHYANNNGLLHPEAGGE